MREKEWETLREEIRACRQCKEKFGFEPRPVVFGSPEAKIMQISQAPSRNVHQTGKPFDDASGKKLREEWYQIPDEVFYCPEHFYIVSIAHCYPGKAPRGGDRRPPRECADRWLTREMEFVDNEIYVLIGGAAAGYFFPGERITDLVFQEKRINGKPAYVMPHPSPLNVKWFMDNPDFLEKRIVEIRRQVHKVLGM